MNLIVVDQSVLNSNIKEQNLFIDSLIIINLN